MLAAFCDEISFQFKCEGLNPEKSLECDFQYHFEDGTLKKISLGSQRKLLVFQMRNLAELGERCGEKCPNFQA